MDIRFDFTDKVAIITGAAGGLGKETAVQFARAGAKVVIGDVKAELGKKTVEEIKADGGKAVFVDLDVTSKDSVEKMVKATIEAFGGVDILVNVAGLSASGPSSAFTDLTTEQWDLTYQVNLRGQVYCCQAIYDIFKEQKRGKIVNVSSVAGKMAAPTVAHYAASKASSISFTRSLAHDMAAFNVNVNGVCPGWIWTPIYSENKHMSDRAEKMNLTSRQIFDAMIKALVPLKREQTEQDVAFAILFLCSEAARNITAQNINIDGGAVFLG
jgi:NAD(P)-dependent dehydrogenase (short-subunit alcohol dehydrogenase family)